MNRRYVVGTGQAGAEGNSGERVPRPALKGGDMLRGKGRRTSGARCAARSSRHPNRRSNPQCTVPSTSSRRNRPQTEPAYPPLHRYSVTGKCTFEEGNSATCQKPVQPGVAKPSAKACIASLTRTWRSNRTAEYTSSRGITNEESTSKMFRHNCGCSNRTLWQEEW
jgi:hypothetical protein